jgi:predicted metal-dependent peptidase
MVMAHEAYHVLLDHIKVRKENHKLWNICCDVIVNTLLLHEANFKIGAELQQMLWDAKKIDYPEHNLIHYISAEDLYDELEPQVKKVQKMMEQYDAAAGMANDMQPSNAKGTGPNAEANQKPETEDSSGQQNDPSKAENDPNDPRNSKGKDEDPQEYPWQEEEEPESSGATPDEHKGWGNINEGECDQIKRELKNNGTFDRAQKAGKTPAGIARAFEALEQPFNWQKILEKFIASVIKRRDTWERPNRRLVAAFPETRLPTQTTLHEHKILVYADMSGSIGPEEVSRFVSVLQKAPHEVKISAFSFDTKIYAWPGWDKGEMPRGGGGTSFLQVVRHAEEQKGNYDAIVVLTDGYDSEPSPKQAKKWLWVSTAAFPGGSYGEVVKKNQGKYKSGWWIKMPESGKKRRR